MADYKKIQLGVEFTGEIGASLKQALSALEQSLGKLSGHFAQTSEAVKGVSQNMSKSVEKAAQDNKKSAHLFTISFSSIAAESEKLGRAYTTLLKHISGGSITLEKASRMFDIVVRAQSRIADEAEKNAISADKQRKAAEKLSEQIKKNETNASSLEKEFSGLAKTNDKLAEAYARLHKAVSNGDVKFRQARRELQSLSDESKNTTTALGGLKKAFATIAKYGVVSAVIYKITKTLREGFSAIVDYDQSLRDLQAISGTSAGVIEQMGEAIKAVANDTKFSVTEVAEGVRLLEQAGLSAGEAIGTIGAASTLAAGTLSSMQDTTDLLSTTIRSFGDQIQNANVPIAVFSTTIADVMANAVNKSKLTIDKLRTAFNYVGSSASMADVTLQQTATSLALLANKGLRASTIGTGFRQVLSRMIDPSEKLQAALGEVGLSVDDINPSMVGFEQALKNLAPVLEGHTKGVVDMGKAYDIFQLRGAQIASILVSSVLSPDYQKMNKKISETGTSAEMAGIQAEGLGYKIKNLSDKVKLVFVSLGEAGFDKVIGGVVDGLRSIAEWLADIADSDGTRFVVTMAAVVAAVASVIAIGAGLISVLGTVTTGLAMLMTTAGGFAAVLTGGVAVAISAVVAGLIMYNGRLERNIELNNKIIGHNRQLISSLEIAEHQLKQVNEEYGNSKEFGEKLEKVIIQLIKAHPELAKSVDVSSKSYEGLNSSIREARMLLEKGMFDKQVDSVLTLDREVKNLQNDIESVLESKKKVEEQANGSLSWLLLDQDRAMISEKINKLTAEQIDLIGKLNGKKQEQQDYIDQITEKTKQNAYEQQAALVNENKGMEARKNLLKMYIGGQLKAIQSNAKYKESTEGIKDVIKNALRKVLGDTINDMTKLASVGQATEETIGQAFAKLGDIGKEFRKVFNRLGEEEKLRMLNAVKSLGAQKERMSEEIVNEAEKNKQIKDLLDKSLEQYSSILQEKLDKKKELLLQGTAEEQVAYLKELDAGKKTADNMKSLLDQQVKDKTLTAEQAAKAYDNIEKGITEKYIYEITRRQLAVDQSIKEVQEKYRNIELELNVEETKKHPGEQKSEKELSLAKIENARKEAQEIEAIQAELVASLNVLIDSGSEYYKKAQKEREEAGINVVKQQIAAVKAGQEVETEILNGSIEAVKNYVNNAIIEEQRLSEVRKQLLEKTYGESPNDVAAKNNDIAQIELSLAEKIVDIKKMQEKQIRELSGEQSAETKKALLETEKAVKDAEVKKTNVVNAEAHKRVVAEEQALKSISKKYAAYGKQSEVSFKKSQKSIYDSQALGVITAEEAISELSNIEESHYRDTMAKAIDRYEEEKKAAKGNEEAEQAAIERRDSAWSNYYDKLIDKSKRAADQQSKIQEAKSAGLSTDLAYELAMVDNQLAQGVLSEQQALQQKKELQEAYYLNKAKMAEQDLINLHINNAQDIGNEQELINAKKAAWADYYNWKNGQEKEAAVVSKESGTPDGSGSRNYAPVHGHLNLPDIDNVIGDVSDAVSVADEAFTNLTTSIKEQIDLIEDNISDSGKLTTVIGSVGDLIKGFAKDINAGALNFDQMKTQSEGIGGLIDSLSSKLDKYKGSLSEVSNEIDSVSGTIESATGVFSEIVSDFSKIGESGLDEFSSSWKRLQSTMKEASGATAGLKTISKINQELKDGTITEAQAEKEHKKFSEALQKSVALYQDAAKQALALAQNLDSVKEELESINKEIESVNSELKDNITKEQTSLADQIEKISSDSAEQRIEIEKELSEKIIENKKQLAEDIKDVEKKLQEDLVSINESTDDKIRKLQQGLMSDAEKYADNKLRVEELLQKGKLELQEGDSSGALESFKEAQDLAASLASEVKDEQGNVIYSLQQTTADAMALVSELGEKLKIASAFDSENHIKTLQQQSKGSIDELRQFSITAKEEIAITTSDLITEAKEQTAIAIQELEVAAEESLAVLTAKKDDIEKVYTDIIAVIGENGERALAIINNAQMLATEGLQEYSQALRSQWIEINSVIESTEERIVSLTASLEKLTQKLNSMTVSQATGGSPKPVDSTTSGTSTFAGGADGVDPSGSDIGQKVATLQAKFQAMLGEALTTSLPTGASSIGAYNISKIQEQVTSQYNKAFQEKVKELYAEAGLNPPEFLPGLNAFGTTADVAGFVPFGNTVPPNKKMSGIQMLRRNNSMNKSNTRGSTPALLEPQKYVEPKNIVSKYGKDFFDFIKTGLMPADSIRSLMGRVRGYSSGGMAMPSGLPRSYSFAQQGNTGSVYHQFQGEQQSFMNKVELVFNINGQKLSGIFSQNTAHELINQLKAAQLTSTF